MDKQSICGLVENKVMAEKIILSLVEAGVNPSEISILSSQEEMLEARTSDRPSQEMPRDWRTENRVPGRPADEKLSDVTKSKFETHTHAAEGATAGATTGGFVGGALGLLAGIGALAIPGIGPLVAAGPLLAALSGFGAGGTIGGILGALIGVGIPEKEAQHYEDRLKEGSILVSACAHNESQAKSIMDILKQHRAQNISASAKPAALKPSKK